MTTKVYICTPLSNGKFNLKRISETILKSKVQAFIPPVGQLEDKYTGALLDKLQIDLCDELWAFGPLGRDCCWEIGYAVGLGKRVKVFVDGTNTYLRDEDWMVGLGVEFIHDNINKE